MLQPRPARELCFEKRFAFLSSCRYNGCRERKKEMNKTRVAVKAVIVCNGCFLLLERRQNGEEGIYDLPGGGVETGESHTQALTREIFEETGLTVRIKRPLRTWSFSPRAGETLYGVTFLAEYLSGTVRLSAARPMPACLAGSATKAPWRRKPLNGNATPFPSPAFTAASTALSAGKERFC